MLYSPENTTWEPEPATCGSCGHPVASLHPCTWDRDLMVGECCRVRSDDLPSEPICPALRAMLMQAETAGELPGLVKLHAITCVHCASDQATVQTDRLYVNPDAVCCGEAA